MRKKYIKILFSSVLLLGILIPLSLSLEKGSLTNLSRVKEEIPKLSYQIPDVPYHYQINSYYCGPASLEMIFDYYGEDIPQDEIAEVARTDNYEGGTFYFELRRAAHFSDLSISKGTVVSGHINGYSSRKIGYAAFTTHLKNSSCLKSLLDEGYPVLVTTWSSEEKLGTHFRVVIGYTIENEKISNFILHDPALGPYYAMEHDYFVELWDSHANWTMVACPWEVNISYPTSVIADSSFLINASVHYPCPLFFDANEFCAYECSASISLPNGFQLAMNENKTKVLNNGTMLARDTEFCQWNVTSGDTNINGQFLINVVGKVKGSVPQHYIYNKYTYFDYIGKSSSFLITITGGFSFDIILIIMTISFIGLGVSGISYFIVKKIKSPKNLA